MKRTEVQNILYIGLNQEFGSQERLILGDGQMALETGKKPFFLCYKNSALSKKVEEKKMNVIYRQGPFSIKFLFSSLPKLIRDNNIDLVHCYDIESVWTLGHFLYRLIEIPLVLTQYNEIKHFYTGIFYRLFSSRIDAVVVLFPRLKENIGPHLKIHRRKIHFCGPIPLDLNIRDQDKTSRKKKDIILIGVYLSGREKNDSLVRSLFRALVVFNQRLGQEVHLRPVSDSPWEAHPFYQKYRALTWEYQVGDRIIFSETENIFEFQKGLDLWVGLAHKDDFEDYTLSASLQNIPFLVPRTGVSIEFLEFCGPLGESYKRGDGRELWQKGLRILQHIEDYRRHLKKAQKTLRQIYNRDHYEEKLLSLYDNAKGRRWAYTWRKQQST